VTSMSEVAAATIVMYPRMTPGAELSFIGKVIETIAKDWNWRSVVRVCSWDLKRVWKGVVPD
jgi:hypothetical protein